MCIITNNIVNIKTIAKLADVSFSAVSRVLSGKNKKVNSNAERIYEIAEKLGYKENLLENIRKIIRNFVERQTE